jgi:hypothetical protein
MTHVAWNCDGKKLAAVGIDKVTRVWMPEKSVSETYSCILGINVVYLDGAQGCNDFYRRAF